MPVLLSNSGQVSARPGGRGESYERKLGFVPATSVPRLRSNEIHLWTMAPSHTEIAEFASLLSPTEIDRAQRFRFPALSERFVADHGRLRLLLAAYLEADPQGLRFAENEQGKPRLLHGPDCRLRFNMSHTRGLTMIALCLDAELGVDIEAVRQVEDRDDIAAMYFSSSESLALGAYPEPERDAAFLRCWTRKEAYMKARGEGLSLPLDQFAVSLSVQKAALVSCDWDEQEPRRWMLEHLEPGPGYIGALAVEQGAWSLLHFAWPPDNPPHTAAGDRS